MSRGLSFEPVIRVGPERARRGSVGLTTSMHHWWSAGVHKNMSTMVLCPGVINARVSLEFVLYPYFDTDRTNRPARDDIVSLWTGKTRI